MKGQIREGKGEQTRKCSGKNVKNEGNGKGKGVWSDFGGMGGSAE